MKNVKVTGYYLIRKETPKGVETMQLHNKEGLLLRHLKDNRVITKIEGQTYNLPKVVVSVC